MVGRQEEEVSLRMSQQNRWRSMVSMETGGNSNRAMKGVSIFGGLGRDWNTEFRLGSRGKRCQKGDSGGLPRS